MRNASYLQEEQQHVGAKAPYNRMDERGQAELGGTA